MSKKKRILKGLQLEVGLGIQGDQWANMINTDTSIPRCLKGVEEDVEVELV